LAKLSCRGNISFTDRNPSLHGPVHPSGLRPLKPNWVPAGNQNLGLSATTLLDGRHPGFSSAAKA